MASDYSADVVVVGTGVVGCLIAEQALDAGLSVLMLEAGPRVDRWRIVENFRNLPPRVVWPNAAVPCRIRRLGTWPEEAVAGLSLGRSRKRYKSFKPD